MIHFEEPGDDQTYFSISESDKNTSEQLMGDSQGTPDSSQVSAVPPINTSFSNISTEFVTESLCGSMSKENILMLQSNTDTSQLLDNSTIPSFLTNCNTPHLANMMDNSSTNQTTKKIEAQLTAMKSYKM